MVPAFQRQVPGRRVAGVLRVRRRRRLRDGSAGRAIGICAKSWRGLQAGGAPGPEGRRAQCRTGAAQAEQRASRRLCATEGEAVAGASTFESRATEAEDLEGAEIHVSRPNGDVLLTN